MGLTFYKCNDDKGGTREGACPARFNFPCNMKLKSFLLLAVATGSLAQIMAPPSAWAAPINKTPDAKPTGVNTPVAKPSDSKSSKGAIPDKPAWNAKYLTPEFVASIAKQPPVVLKINGKPVKVAAGTRVRLELQQYLSSKGSRDGDEVHYKVTSDVKNAAGVVVIRQGVIAIGQVTNRKGAKGFGRSGEFSFDARTVPAVDGSRIPLVFNYQQKARNSSGVMKILTFSANPFMKGGKAKIKPGAIFDALIGKAPIEPQATPVATKTPLKK